MSTFNEKLDQFDRENEAKLHAAKSKADVEKQQETQFKADAELYLRTVAFPAVEMTKEELNQRGHNATARFYQSPHGRPAIEFTFLAKGSHDSVRPVSFKVEAVEHMKTLVVEEQKKIAGGTQSSPSQKFTIAQLTPDVIRQHLLDVVRSTLS